MQLHTDQNSYVEITTYDGTTMRIHHPTGFRVDITDAEIRVAIPGTPRNTDGSVVYRFAALPGK